MNYLFTLCLMLLFSPVAAEMQDLPWDFSLPENYVMMEKEHDGNEAIFFTPRGLNLQEIDCESEISQPLIFGIKMQFPNSFVGDMEQMAAEIKKQFPVGSDVKFLKWGNYPILAIKLMIGQDPCYIAYASLEDNENNGFMFTFIYPRTKEFGNGNKPTKEELEFWNHFLGDTKPIFPVGG
ncbi:MAG: hypothetical protein ACSNEK_09150 [Parachlamydiaceae bacterium]